MSQEFDFNEELMELRSMTRGFCEAESPESAVRETMESASGFDPTLWRRLGTELGVLGLAVPEIYGGAGASLVHQAIVNEELGSSLVCGPIFGTLCLAIPTLLAIASDEAKRNYLPQIVAGESIATLVVPLSTGQIDLNEISVTATRSDEDQWILTGVVNHVPDGSNADLLLVAARTAEGVALFATTSSTNGVTTTSLTTMDLTRRQARVELRDAASEMISSALETPLVLSNALSVATALLSIDQVGGSQKMLDTTIAYVSARLQFGQPIGAFQAVKHRCANMLIALEQARSVAYHAIWAIEGNTDDIPLAVSMAKAVASESYLFISRSAIQLHGGVGFTWEGSPQLYFKRATTDALFLGTSEAHIEQIARRALDHALLARP